jgi:hypothetical protein
MRHTRTKHSLRYYCVECEKWLLAYDLTTHKKANPEHTIMAPWEFAPLTWPTIDSR